MIAYRIIFCKQIMNRRLKLIAILVLALSIMWAMRPKSSSATATVNVQQFLEANCVACHDSHTKKGNLDLTALKFELTDEKTFATWVKIHDRVRDGEMPPKSAPQPEATIRAGFLKVLSEPMIAADAARIRREGRAVLRRMNRYEYENTLRDLLGARLAFVETGYGEHDQRAARPPARDVAQTHLEEHGVADGEHRHRAEGDDQEHLERDRERARRKTEDALHGGLLAVGAGRYRRDGDADLVVLAPRG